MMKTSVLAIIATLCIPQLAQAQDTSWREGGYLGISLGYNDSEVSWITGGGGTISGVPATGPSVGFRGGYDVAIAPNMGAGIEISFAPSAGGLGDATPCNSGNRIRNCRLELENALQLGGRFMYDIHDGGALLVRGGFAMVDITTRRQRIGAALGEGTEDQGTGAYFGIGYTREIAGNFRFTGDITHTNYGRFDSIATFQGRDGLELSTTALNLGLEMRF